MLKFIRIYNHYYLGLSLIGIIAFAIQEIPYMIMPFISLKSNPIMNMENEIKWLETAQGICGVVSVILLMLLVRDDVQFFSVETAKEKFFFAMALAMIMVNFAG